MEVAGKKGIVGKQSARKERACSVFLALCIYFVSNFNLGKNDRYVFVSRFILSCVNWVNDGFLFFFFLKKN